MIELISLSGAILALPLGVFCFVLARRLRRLNDLESGLGGAIAVMTSEISRLESAMKQTRDEATALSRHLAANIEKARTEKAYWALQAKLAKAGAGAEPAAPVRRLRPRKKDAA
ncbi:MAG: hypothetical protein Q4F71_10325 [Paracoccus sp. (in: a-proteobacteria)]|nr:hypothetical protein [Paracoccus sp. (in: a-proteobacteria)]